MRRLANQSRDDIYSSTRDYQSIEHARSLRFVGLNREPATLVFRAPPFSSDDVDPFFAFGAFVKLQVAADLTVAVLADGRRAEAIFKVSSHWTRVGLAAAMTDPAAGNAGVVTLSFTGVEWIDIWGGGGSQLVLPPAVRSKHPDLKALNSRHLAPETYYLSQSAALSLEVDEEKSSKLVLDEGDSIELKKCSYCGRMLPLDSSRLGVLSFHKHLAKRTRHQNECRACKKWRINDDFNPLRTVDQLHESSLITRERSLLLREPEILQAIKERTGRGLKSITWDKFNRSCFNCGRALELSEVQLDHTRPLAYLWPIDEHATCLCAECNNHKTDRFPIDFYSTSQLEVLIEVTGLHRDELSVRRVNPVELQRVIDNVVEFSRTWDPRTFASTARRVSSVEAEVDLFEILRSQDQSAYLALQAALEDRPDPVQ